MSSSSLRPLNSSSTSTSASSTRALDSSISADAKDQGPDALFKFSGSAIAKCVGVLTMGNRQVTLVTVTTRPKNQLYFLVSELEKRKFARKGYWLDIINPLFVHNSPIIKVTVSGDRPSDWIGKDGLRAFPCSIPALEVIRERIARSSWTPFSELIIELIRLLKIDPTLLPLLQPYKGTLPVSPFITTQLSTAEPAISSSSSSSSSSSHVSRNRPKRQRTSDQGEVNESIDLTDSEDKPSATQASSLITSLAPRSKHSASDSSLSSGVVRERARAEASTSSTASLSSVSALSMSASSVVDADPNLLQTVPAPFGTEGSIPGLSVAPHRDGALVYHPPRLGLSSVSRDNFLSSSSSTAEGAFSSSSRSSSSSASFGMGELLMDETDDTLRREPDPVRFRSSLVPSSSSSSSSSSNRLSPVRVPAEKSELKDISINVLPLAVKSKKLSTPLKTMFSPTNYAECVGLLTICEKQITICSIHNRPDDQLFFLLPELEKQKFMLQGYWTKVMRKVFPIKSPAISVVFVGDNPLNLVTCHAMRAFPCRLHDLEKIAAHLEHSRQVTLTKFFIELIRLLKNDITLLRHLKSVERGIVSTPSIARTSDSASGSSSSSSSSSSNVAAPVRARPASAGLNKKRKRNLQTLEREEVRESLNLTDDDDIVSTDTVASSASSNISSQSVYSSSSSGGEQWRSGVEKRPIASDAKTENTPQPGVSPDSLTPLRTLSNSLSLSTSSSSSSSVSSFSAGSMLAGDAVGRELASLETLPATSLDAGVPSSAASGMVQQMGDAANYDPSLSLANASKRILPRPDLDYDALHLLDNNSDFSSLLDFDSPLPPFVSTTQSSSSSSSSFSVVSSEIPLPSAGPATLGSAIGVDVSRPVREADPLNHTCSFFVSSSSSSSSSFSRELLVDADLASTSPVHDSHELTDTASPRSSGMGFLNSSSSYASSVSSTSSSSSASVAPPPRTTAIEVDAKSLPFMRLGLPTVAAHARVFNAAPMSASVNYPHSQPTAPREREYMFNGNRLMLMPLQIVILENAFKEQLQLPGEMNNKIIAMYESILRSGCAMLGSTQWSVAAIDLTAKLMPIYSNALRSAAIASHRYRHFSAASASSSSSENTMPDASPSPGLRLS